MSIQYPEQDLRDAKRNYAVAVSLSFSVFAFLVSTITKDILRKAQMFVLYPTKGDGPVFSHIAGKQY